MMVLLENSLVSLRELFVVDERSHNLFII